MNVGNVLDRVLGRALKDHEEAEHKVGPWTGIPMVGLDALGSSAYGPEAALTVLLPLGALGAHLMLPTVAAIVVLLLIVGASYMQTISAYPNGGGAYRVARENLGKQAGLIAACSLMIDYVLDVAVGISAGVGALISAVPSLQPHTLAICLGILVLITFLNLRGVKESGAALSIPTYGFILLLGASIVVGLFRVVVLGHPEPADVLHRPTLHVTESLGLWIILRAFSSGCSALTGVEAVSNCTGAFKNPAQKNAKITLGLIVGILAIFLLGIAFLAHAYQIIATEPGQAGYESLISQLARAVWGRSFLYYVTMLSVILVLALSANTGFADFPRVCQIIARDHFMPAPLTALGRRLVFSNGIVLLAVLSGILLSAFDGITDRLIPLFAIGAFLSFTFSQAGMVMHWRRAKGRPLALAMNFTGALVTALTTVILFVSKFSEGAWITAVLVLVLYLVMNRIRYHYFLLSRELHTTQTINSAKMRPILAIIPLKSWNRETCQALELAMKVGEKVIGVHAQRNPHTSELLKRAWERNAASPARESQLPIPQLEVLSCPRRQLFRELLDFIDDVGNRYPDHQLAVVVPHLIERKWYTFFLHSHRATLMKLALLFQRRRKVAVITVPWYVSVK